MPFSKMEEELKVWCHHLCSPWPGAFLAPSSALQGGLLYCFCCAVATCCGEVKDTECANVLAGICEGPSLPRRELGKSTLEDDAQGRRCVHLAKGTNWLPEQLTLESKSQPASRSLGDFRWDLIKVSDLWSPPCLPEVLSSPALPASSGWVMPEELAVSAMCTGTAKTAQEISSKDESSSLRQDICNSSCWA